MKIIFYKDYVHFKKGLLIVKDYYAFYDDIKDLETVHYPLSSKGNVQFNVAGETVVQGRGQAGLMAQRQTISIQKHGFKLCYAEGIQELDDKVDSILYARPMPEAVAQLPEKMQQLSKEIYSTKPVFWNDFFIWIPVFAVLDGIVWLVGDTSAAPSTKWLPVAIAVNILILGLRILHIFMTSYTLEG